MSDTLQELSEAMKAAGVTHLWEKLPPSHKKRYLNWIDEAKRSETRIRRIAQAVTMVSDET